MAIHYKVESCVNPAGTAGTTYACNRETAAGHIDFDTIAEEVSYMTSVTFSDVKGILSSYLHHVYSKVADGTPVQLVDLGTFVPGISSQCFAQSEISQPTFKPRAKIRDVKLMFRVNTYLKERVTSNNGYKREPSELMA